MKWEVRQQNGAGFLTGKGIRAEEVQKKQERPCVVRKEIRSTKRERVLHRWEVSEPQT